jgi:4-hydroxymandelate oxidase
MDAPGASSQNESNTMSLIARRRFLNFLAASPLLQVVGPASAFPDESDDASALPEYLIKTPAEALDVFDFRDVARHVLPKSHYGYLATGTDGNETLLANREAFKQIYLRAMRMVDSRNVDLSTTLLGERLSSPILLAPVGSQRAFHGDGEVATARAARAQGHLQILSNVSSISIEDVIEARGEPVWFQLYPTTNWSTARTMLLRAQNAGAEVIVLTVDLNAGSNRIMLGKFSRSDERDCTACHGSDPDDWLLRKPMYANTEATTADLDTPGMTWDFLARLRDTSSMKIVVKGIVTAEDADSSVRYGADAVYVSNHGGRAEASGWGTIESLPEVVAAVQHRVPVIVDSGFRRGTDIFKALAIGADAVSIGRPYIWGLAAFGQPGVERVLEMLKAELAMVMAQMGARTMGEIDAKFTGWRRAGPS